MHSKATFVDVLLITESRQLLKERLK